MLVVRFFRTFREMDRSRSVRGCRVKIELGCGTVNVMEMLSLVMLTGKQIDDCCIKNARVTRTCIDRGVTCLFMNCVEAVSVDV